MLMAWCFRTRASAVTMLNYMLSHTHEFPVVNRLTWGYWGHCPLLWCRQWFPPSWQKLICKDSFHYSSWSKFDRNFMVVTSKCYWSNCSKIWPCHGSTIVMACAKFCGNFIARDIIGKNNFHRTWIVVENFVVKWDPFRVGIGAGKYYWTRRILTVRQIQYSINTLRPRQNGRRFTAFSKLIFLNENVWISIKISLNFCY